MGRHVFVSGSRAYTFASRRRRRDSQIKAFQRECSEQKVPSYGGHSTQNRLTATTAQQSELKRSENSAHSQSKNPGNSLIVPTGTATRMQIWELMLFFRIPYEQAIAYSYERASSLLGRLSVSQKQALVKQAQGSASLAHETGPLRQGASRSTISVPAAGKQRNPKRSKRTLASKKAVSPSTKQYIVPIRFHVLVEARTAVLGRAAGMQSAKRFLKMARTAGVAVEMSSLVSERALLRPDKHNTAAAIGGRH